MKKTLFYRLFGWGQLPKAMRPILESEGIVLFDEGLGGTITLRNYRSPTRRSGYRCSWFTGSLVVTGLRFAAFSISRPLINVPLDVARLASARLLHRKRDKAQSRVRCRRLRRQYDRKGRAALPNGEGAAFSRADTSREVTPSLTDRRSAGSL
ncbi:MAG: hypothetical protein E2P02_21905 [Acidobacteria bacterium]|nr:MAG: hypothetical protein E2P02_21905 [Acidobacteriota bacterium]